MLFNTPEYFVFLALVLLVYYQLLRTYAAQRLWILASSAIFYAYWSIPFLFHFAAVVTANYFVGEAISNATSTKIRKRILTAAIAANLLNLFAFKYVGLAIESINQLMAGASFGFHAIPKPQIVLPLAISFYTFHVISYIVDIYNRHADSRANSLWDFLFYVTLFPHQIAGPILRGHELFPQLGYRRAERAADMREGARRLVVGLFQKALIADNLSLVVDHGYNNVSSLSGLDAYTVLVAYSFQIFFDFAGYSNMGIGAARMLGYRLPENFSTPYLAQSISEFWRRWHMTLSRWIRDYIFIPLGGSRGSQSRTSANLLATMGLAGLWHGAAWTFVVWGLLHGIALVVARIRFFRNESERQWSDSSFGKWIAILLTFHFVTITWVFFRAVNFRAAFHMLERVGQIFVEPLHQTVDPALLLKTYGFTGMVVYGVGVALYRIRWVRGAIEQEQRRLWIALAAMIVLVALFSPQNAEPFIYFQF